jgi:hypothetical protein
MPHQPNGKIYQVCKYCGKSKHSEQKPVTAWTEHLVIKCKDAPQSVRRGIAAKSSSKIIQNYAKTEDLLGDCHPVDVVNRSNKIQNTMDDCLDHCDEARAERINMRV